MGSQTSTARQQAFSDAYSCGIPGKSSCSYCPSYFGIVLATFLCYRECFLLRVFINSNAFLFAIGKQEELTYMDVLHVNFCIAPLCTYAIQLCHQLAYMGCAAL